MFLRPTTTSALALLDDFASDASGGSGAGSDNDDNNDEGAVTGEVWSDDEDNFNTDGQIDDDIDRRWIESDLKLFYLYQDKLSNTCEPTNVFEKTDQPGETEESITELPKHVTAALEDDNDNDHDNGDDNGNSSNDNDDDDDCGEDRLEIFVDTMSDNEGSSSQEGEEQGDTDDTDYV